MKDMTLTQSYFVCAVGRRGQLSGLSVERQVCLLGAGLLELALAGAVGNALVSAGLAKEARGGLFGGKTRYIPQDEAINRVVDMMRAELLEEGEYSDEAAALGVLLDKGNCMKEYFSKFEQR